MTGNTTHIVRIEAPYFVAGVDVSNRTGLVVHAAPILKYMRGWTEQRVFQYCDRKGWKAMVI